MKLNMVIVHRHLSVRTSVGHEANNWACDRRYDFSCPHRKEAYSAPAHFSDDMPPQLYFFNIQHLSVKIDLYPTICDLETYPSSRDTAYTNASISDLYMLPRKT